MKVLRILPFFLFLFLVSCSNSQPTQQATAPTPTAPPAKPKPPVYKGPFGDMKVPADNLVTEEKAELGKQLFFDKRLSKNGKMSCETCHVPEKGWADGKTFSAKFDGSMNMRHTPTLYNVGYYTKWYWDGRAATLEAVVLAAWKGQMGGDPDAAATALNGIEGYKTQFEKVMGGPATGDTIAQALATFLRTINSGVAPWDRYEAGDKTAVSTDVLAGNEIFTHFNKANCTLCHLPPVYTDTLFHNVGIGTDKPMPDMGRGKFLADQAQKDGKPDPSADGMMGAFKTPSLRGVVNNAPYFHDGRAKTLEQAVDIMAGGGIKNGNIDSKLKHRNISPKEKTLLIAFIKSLTPEQKPFERPKLP